MHHKGRTISLAYWRLIKAILCTPIYVLLDPPGAAVAAIKYVRVYKVFPIAYISYSIYMTRGLINAMIQLLIVYFVMTEVDEFINVNMYKLIKR